MNAAWHYREAERLLAEYATASHGGHVITPRVLTRAQVHATLALAGATDGGLAAEEPESLEH
jgi:hypothetical protein